MSKSEAALSAATLIKRPSGVEIGRDNVLGTVESLLGPCAFVFSLWAIALFFFDGELPPPVLILSVLVFALTFPGQSHLQSSLGRVVLDIVLNWIWVAGLMLAMDVATGYIREFTQDILVTCLWAAPASELGLHLLLRTVAPLLLKLQGPNQRAIIVGMNEQGAALANRIRETPYSRIDLVGFIDSRETRRLAPMGDQKLLGKLDALAVIAKSQHVQLIYLSLPMASQPRILQVLDDLKDTTASIYFVPDMFFTDLIQGHSASVVGMPVISVCETPFRGADGIVKRISDIVLSSLILLLTAPLLLLIAIAVKVTSPGPIIFMQRRYGLGGEEIVV